MKNEQEIEDAFLKAMDEAVPSEINWLVANELETEEKIQMLCKLSIERKLIILENLKNEEQ